MMNGSSEGVRIDKWLWAARFFKTRSIASQAVSGGKVHLNGGRVKPARTVREGDELVISKGPYTFRVTVLGLSSRRGPATAARLLYEEAPESVLERERQREMNRLVNAGHNPPVGRPGKRDGGRIKEFLRKD